jgi:hypothetical protein
MKMKLTPPTMLVFWISVALVVIGLIAKFVPIAVLSGLSFWLVAAGAVLLIVALLVKKL